MPAITLNAARANYDKAVTRLRRACLSLEYHIPNPPADNEEEIPADHPRERIDSVAGCALCSAELTDKEPG